MRRLSSWLEDRLVPGVAPLLLASACACTEGAQRGVIEAPPLATQSANVAALSKGGGPAKRSAQAKAKEGFPANPLISRGKKVTSNRDGARNLVDGEYRSDVWQAGKPTPDKPAWVAIDVGVGPKRLLLSWTSSGSFNYLETTYGGPGAYRIETSADSTNGENGSWKTVASVEGNTVRTRAHSFGFEGQRWVRLVVTAPSATTYEYGVQLDEIDIHDVSAGADDTWFFLGDSITALSFDRAKDHQPSFAEAIHQRAPAYFPAMINGGIGGETARDGLRHLDSYLAMNPDFKYWAIGYGTNDSSGNGNPGAPEFKKNLRALVSKLKAAGRVPVLARIPYAPEDHDMIPAFNKVIDELTAELGLIPGPDLYTHFKKHPDELRDDKLHPNDKGMRSINRLWAEAMAKLYAP